MEILLIAALTFVSGLVGTISGFGLSTIMLPVLILFYSLPESLLFVGIIHAFSDFWKILLFKHAFNEKVILYFGIPGIIAGLLGASIVLSAPQTLLIRIFGLVILTYSLFVVFKPHFKLPMNMYYSVSGGTLSGFLAGIFGMGGLVRSVFLSAFNLPKSVYIFASGAIGLIIDSGRLFTYYFGGVRLEDDLIRGLIIYIPVTLLSAEAAKKLVLIIPQKQFRSIIAVFIFAIGIKLFLAGK